MNIYTLIGIGYVLSVAFNGVLALALCRVAARSDRALEGEEIERRVR